MSSRFSDWTHRLGQGLRALRPIQIPEDRDDMLSSVLTELQAGAFRSLPAYDQAHLLGVHARLVSAGVVNPDLLAAGLLHDLGKADQRGHVRLPDRTARVLLRRISPELLNRLAASPDQGLLHGLHLCVHHPRLGAERAVALGCTARTIWLIAHHEASNVPYDGDLAALQIADRG